MNIEEIIRAWKSDEQALESHLPVSPVGKGLGEEELLAISGSDDCSIFTCVPSDFTFTVCTVQE
jgi:hypothetical protein